MHGVISLIRIIIHTNFWSGGKCQEIHLGSMLKLIYLLTFISINSFAGELRFEGALTDFSRNEIAIPGDKGDLFDTTEGDWKQKNGASYRLYYTHPLDAKSTLRLLYAPLATSFEGSFSKSTNFNGQIFNPGPAQVNYKFNSYRLGYFRRLYQSESLIMNYGFVGKIRDAKIEVVQGVRSTTRKDLGLVPLLHFDLKYNFYEDLSIYFDLDGLAAPQGRAFDSGLFVQRNFQNRYEVFVGYRFLEGGADNDKVKTFSFVNYYTLGASFKF